MKTSMIIILCLIATPAFARDSHYIPQFTENRSHFRENRNARPAMTRNQSIAHDNADIQRKRIRNQRQHNRMVSEMLEMGRRQSREADRNSRRYNKSKRDRKNQLVW